jgi:Ca2+-binding RTX toxin-like protein
MATEDFLTHPDDEFVSDFGDGVTGYFGQTFVAIASNLTQIEFELDPFVGFGPGPTDYTVLVASVILDSNGNFVRPDQLLFESEPLTFTVDADDFAWQPVTVPVSGLDLTAGQTYIFLLNANFGGNAARGAARIAAIGVGEDLPIEPGGNAVFLHQNNGSIALDFASDDWFNLQDDLAYRLTYDDTPPPPGIVLPGTNKDDDLVGTAGNDELSGNNGADTIKGLGGNDKLNGENGNDNLSGGTGDDILDGGNGADTLNGGSGTNTLTGGHGRDNFDFDASAFGTHTVTDFDVGQDHIRLSGGVTATLNDAGADVELTLSAGGQVIGQVILLGVQVDELQPLL